MEAGNARLLRYSKSGSVLSDSKSQDRLSKSRIYAGNAVPQYLIVNLRDDQIEVLADPDPTARVYRQQHVAHRGKRVALVAFPDTVLLVDDLLPGPADD